MNIKKLSENVFDIENNLSKYNDIDLNLYVSHTDKLNKVDNQKDVVKFTITDILEIKTLTNKMVLCKSVIGEYLVPIIGTMTLEQLDFLYKRPFVVLKSDFDNFKKNYSTIEKLEFPEYKSLTKTVLSAFQDKLFDVLND